MTQSQCYDSSTGGTKPVADYATHPVAKKYCFPQAKEMLQKVNGKLSGHPIQKYIPMVVSTVRSGWPVLLGSFMLAIILSFVFLMLISCCAGTLIWSCLTFLVVFPAVAGGTLIYASQHGGIDGMPGSGDADTDLGIGIGCCVASALFMLVCCCMGKAINKAIKVMEAAASCLFHVQSMLLEPVISLTARIALWASMLVCFAWLLGTGDVRKSKIYRSFTFTAEEWIYIGFAVMMMLWLNDFCTAVSQYVIAWATAKWYFTEHSGGVKLVPSFLMCKAYASGFIYHLGSLAMGSLIIACTRPLRILVVMLLSAGDVTDNALCGCISKACACCYACFERCLMHLCKNAYIDMAITAKGFCDSARNAANLLLKESAAIVALSGATWLFTLVGLATIPTAGAFITHLLVTSVDTFSNPLSRWYIQDPVVMDCCAGVVCFIVALCFMLVFDSCADTMLLCLAYDMKDQRDNPSPQAQAVAGQPPPKRGCFNSWFSQAPKQQPGQMEMPAMKRPQYAHDKLQALISSRP